MENSILQNALITLQNCDDCNYNFDELIDIENKMTDSEKIYYVKLCDKYSNYQNILDQTFSSQEKLMCVQVLSEIKDDIIEFCNSVYARIHHVL